MTSQIELGDLTVDVILKDIKHVHLRVYRPNGAVRVSAPKHMSISTIRAFAISKLDWIKRQRAKVREWESATPCGQSDGNGAYVWGKRYVLAVSESRGRSFVELRHDNMHLRVRPGTDQDKKQSLVEAWYRERLREALPPLLEKWQPLTGVIVKRFFVQRMKTRWGSCNYRANTIRLNTELVKKPRECLEYVVVHELVHLLEPSHNARFYSLMDRFMPEWRVHREVLERLPAPGETWSS